MAAHCTEPTCRWSGPPTKVVNAGQCPECGAPVSYDGRPLTGSVITKRSDFNRQAVAALRVISTDEWATGFLESIRVDAQHGADLAPNVQQQLYKLTLRYDLALRNKALNDYASAHAKGYA